MKRQGFNAFLSGGLDTLLGDSGRSGHPSKLTGEILRVMDDAVAQARISEIGCATIDRSCADG